jgi:hypothetical protein
MLEATHCPVKRQHVPRCAVVNSGLTSVKELCARHGVLYAAVVLHPGQTSGIAVARRRASVSSVCFGEVLK